MQARFIAVNAALIDLNSSAASAYFTSTSWLSIRLDLLGALVAFSVTLIAVSAHHLLSPAWAALAMTYSFDFTNQLKQWVRVTTESESRMNSVERLKHYAEHVEQEAPAQRPETQPPASWPHEGSVEISQLVVSYKRGAPVLRGLDLSIRPLEKIGVAGRTGSGKSTLMLALLRLVEAEAGAILVDGVDIASLGLADLRGRVAIIPQDPVLFSASVRRNLDPFDHHSDGEIWDVLRLVHLRAYVETLPGRLEYEVAEGGDNFSVGQRQLVSGKPAGLSASDSSSYFYYYCYCYCYFFLFSFCFFFFFGILVLVVVLVVVVLLLFCYYYCYSDSIFIIVIVIHFSSSTR